MARVLAEAIRPAVPGGIFVESKLGASGRLAVQAPRASDPDGSALLFTPDLALTDYPHSFKKLGYDPIKDLTPVTVYVRSGYAFCAGPAVPASVKNMREYVEWVKANPQSALYGSSGAGTTLHFAGIMLEKATGLILTHVPYKGGALSTDVMGGQIPVSINAVGEALPHYHAGKLRVLGTFGAVRSPFMPEVPTMVESGYKDVVSEAWLAVLMPPQIATGASDPCRGCPEQGDLVARIARALCQVRDGTCDEFTECSSRPDCRRYPALGANHQVQRIHR
ncbi:tripartite tricarboxylate transporter substrate-binding protein [Variovorax sp. J22P168]|nr:tripartite tricarboxylate transporter substrate-binding protein [Variovorax sp. J22P168]MDM0015132.1 tripartite tricarboxylate transporter substrate-binding protein [Variovorax sp. J22P168]